MAFVEENRNQSGTHYQNSLFKEVYRLEELSNIYTKSQSLHESQVVFEAQLWITPSHEIIETIR